jgi:tetratricopeptide (TPR) repeat protein
MKSKRKDSKRAAAAAPAESSGTVWRYGLAAALALAVAFQVYAPALNGPFVFDDAYLPMNSPQLADKGLGEWISGVRPLLMATYWLNHTIARASTFGFHVWNVLFHVGNAFLLFLVTRRLCRQAGVRADFAWFAAAVFLLHPMQTESVAYIAGRSETLSALFYFAAFALFLYRRAETVTWGLAAGIFLLLGAALACKEHTVTLPLLLLLTDYFFHPGFSAAGIRRNWRLHAPVLAGALAGAVLLLKRTLGDTSAGFSTEGIRWYEYLFTQCKVIWVYVRMFFLPVGQSADYDYPVSRSLAEPAVVLGLAGLIAATGAALWLARRAPLAAFGWLAFLLMLAPTSSIMPIKDPLVDRRLYLPMLGLLLMVIDGLRRLPVDRKTLGGAMALAAAALGVLTYQRAQVWSDPLTLWEDTVRKSPHNARAHFQLAHAYYSAGRCRESLAAYERVAQLQKPDHRLLVDWGLAYVCLDQTEQAVEKLRAAAALEPTAHVYTQIAMAYGKANRAAEARQALEEAQRIDANYDMTYVYLGHFSLQSDPREAARLYKKALELNPGNPVAPQFLAQAEERIRQQAQTPAPAVTITPTPAPR